MRIGESMPVDACTPPLREAQDMLGQAQDTLRSAYAACRLDGRGSDEQYDVFSVTLLRER